MLETVAAVPGMVGGLLQHLKALLDDWQLENGPAPQIAIDYWGLPQGARLRDVVLAVRGDRAMELAHNRQGYQRLSAYVPVERAGSQDLLRSSPIAARKPHERMK